MDLALRDKLVLITGGSKGIGFACAQAFIEEGARVAIVGRDQATLDKALASLPGAHGFSADLREAEAAAAMVEAVTGALGPIDVLVNSAGAAKRTPAPELTPAAWRAAMDAKYFTTINVVDPVVKRMAARGAGVIINIIGAGGKIASAIHLAGGAANAALMLATAGLANAYAAKGVRVVGINPGQTETDRFIEGMQADARATGLTMAEARARALARIPLGRLAQPADIAQAVLFLASSQASYITGVNISMDGGGSPFVV
ncbi:MAG: SDR family oxidoreductase [Hyphomicrobiales bacterium]|nr:SDR family oxidoreductase [Hyphomicrobiales bacterium]MDE2114734.1 SDR family oxidoreductase [Hyphomicrobiales bacterium]